MMLSGKEGGKEMKGKAGKVGVARWSHVAYE